MRNHSQSSGVSRDTTPYRLSSLALRILGLFVILAVCSAARAQSDFVVPVNSATTGRGIAGAFVRLTCLSGGCGASTYSQTTDTSGNAQFTGVIAGKYTVTISGQQITTYSYTRDVTAANPSNLNNIIFVDGVTYKTIAAAVTALPSCTFGIVSIASTNSFSHCGKVIVSSNTTESSQIAVNSAITIESYSNNTVTYSGSGYQFQCAAGSSSPYAGELIIRGLHMIGTSAASGAIDNQGCTNALIMDNFFEGFTSGIPILFENVGSVAGFNTEQGTIQHNYFINNGTPAIAFEDNCTGHTGCPSFEYTNVRDNEIFTKGSGYGIEALNDSSLTHTDIESRCHLATSSACFYLKDTSTFQFGRLYLRGEYQLAASSGIGIKTDVGAILQVQNLIEDWLSDITDVISGTFVPFVTHDPFASLAQMWQTGIGFCELNTPSTSGQFCDIYPTVNGESLNYTHPNNSGTYLLGALGSPINSTGLTGNLSATTIYTTNSNTGSMGGGQGEYRVCVSSWPTATGSATAIQANAIAPSGAGTVTVTVGSVLSTAAVTNGGGGCTAIHAAASSAIQVSTTGYSGTGTYSIQAAVEQMY